MKNSYDYVLKLSTGPISVTNNFRLDKKSHLKLPRQPKFPKDIHTNKHERFKILRYQNKWKLYFKNGKLHQVENLQRGLILALT